MEIEIYDDYSKLPTDLTEDTIAYCKNDYTDTTSTMTYNKGFYFYNINNSNWKLITINVDVDLSELEDRYEALDLDKHDRMIIDDYIACMNSSMCRANDISYFAGVRDTLSFLIQAGLLKQSEK